IWIELFKPRPEEVVAVNALGVEVPTLADMEEIEISNRLYREGGVDYMTVVLQGHSETRTPVSGPVTFILTQRQLITVRHHHSRPFDTYPERADKVGPGCDSAEHVFLSLIEEVIGRLADLLESVGKGLDEMARGVFDPSIHGPSPDTLQRALEQVGRDGELIGIIRLALLTTERALSFFNQGLGDRQGGDALRPLVKGMFRDINALEVHTDFLSSRVGLSSDATLGMINLAQNSTVKIVSSVAIMFSPPTLIASIYGMNFQHMPELEQAWGYPIALVMMVASSVGAWFFFKWKNWL
ncbi:MAG: magnesium transporter, partial [Rhodobacteraceae bacterium]|nr:magnesium transporter [Paracoccaceae bacterium]